MCFSNETPIYTSKLCLKFNIIQILRLMYRTRLQPIIRNIRLQDRDNQQRGFEVKVEFLQKRCNDFISGILVNFDYVNRRSKQLELQHRTSRKRYRYLFYRIMNIKYKRSIQEKYVLRSKEMILIKRENMYRRGNKQPNDIFLGITPLNII